MMADPGEAPPDPATDSLHSTILGSLRSSRPSAGSARGSIPSRFEEKGSIVIQPSADIAGSVSKLAPSPPPPPPPRQPSAEPIPLRSPPRRTSISVASKASSHIKSPRTSVQPKGDDPLANLEPQGQIISDHIEELNKSVKEFANNMDPENNLDKISDMSKKLTDEAKYLRESIKHLSEDIARVDGAGKRGKICPIDFPYHLFLLELIVNKIQMKCDCFDMDCNNLVISATFLGKHPIILYDSNQGCVEDFYKINVGKSILFAMTYDKICCIEEFEIVMELTKQPPCSHCVTKIGITRMDYTKEFLKLREELCQKWAKEQPKDEILCTTSTPLHKNQFYLSCSEDENPEAIGVIEVSVRMSFLGKEITTEFSASPKPKGTSFMLKEGNGMTMYSCQKVEMDDEGKILLDEDSLTKRYDPPHRRGPPRARSSRSNSPMSQMTSYFSRSPQRNYADQQGGIPRYDEIFTKMNDNELKIRVPKSTKVERQGLGQQYEKIQEVCECEDNAYNPGDQIQFELPSDMRKGDNTYTSKLNYSINTPNTNQSNKDRKVINITPTNCPIPVNMEKQLHLQKDVFILKIGKKLESKDRKTDLEIELVTPKAPSPMPVVNNDIGQQVSSNKLSGKKEKKKKGDGKKKGGAKGSAKAGLGEFRIRDLNDEINKLMREKRHWEVQIKSLGGPDHARVGPRMLDQDGREVPGNRGYKYFGAAKDLPGVRELFEQEPPAPPRRTRADLMRDVDADYYGYRDDDDGLLVPLEKLAEKDAIAQAVEEWKKNKDEDKEQDLPEEENIYPEDPDDRRVSDDDEPQVITSHVAVPSQKDIEEALLRKKKQELLERYGCLDVKMEES